MCTTKLPLILESPDSWTTELLRALRPVDAEPEIRKSIADDILHISDEMVESISGEMRSSYSHVRCFHGARPATVSPYYTEGLRTFRTGREVEDIVRSLIQRSGLDVNEECLEASSLNCSESIRVHAVYFTVAEQFLLEHGSGFARLGSEYVSAVLNKYASLAGVPRATIKGHPPSGSRPTVFVVDIPVDVVDSDAWSSIVLDLLGEWVDKNRARRLWRPIEQTDICVRVEGQVPPHWIVSHHEAALGSS